MEKMSAANAGRLGHAASRNTRIARLRAFYAAYMRKPRRCAGCKAPLSYKKRSNKFCSHRCAGISSGSAHRARRYTRVHICIVCQRRWRRKEGDVGYSHRCLRCRKVHTRKPTFEQAETDRTRKSILLVERGARCEVCKRVQWRGKLIPLELEHSDGNSQNNTRENLKLICPNCHAQTSTYKGKNRGKGRFARTQRYRAKKSY